MKKIVGVYAFISKSTGIRKPYRAQVSAHFKRDGVILERQFVKEGRSLKTVLSGVMERLEIIDRDDDQL